MNALTSLFSTRLPRPQNRDAAPVIARLARPARDFGIGYGSSSGYATAARYVSSPVTTRFRVG